MRDVVGHLMAGLLSIKLGHVDQPLRYDKTIIGEIDVKPQNKNQKYQLQLIFMPINS